MAGAGDMNGMGRLRGRVIIVEDEALLLLELEDALVGEGLDVVGTAARLDTALTLATQASFDLAILDMNLAGERIDPVARIIAQRGISIVFLTGYGGRTMPPGVAAPVLDKPFTMNTLRPLLTNLLDKSRDFPSSR